MNVMEHRIYIKQVQITAVSHKLKDGIMTHSLSVSGHLDQKLAQHLGCADLVFLQNGTPRQGFPQLPLDAECGAFRALFEADPELRQQFEITGDNCNGFVVKRNENGSLSLRFRLHYHGNPHPALGYLEAVGSGASTLALSPLEQGELFAIDAESAGTEAAEPGEDSEPEPEPEPELEPEKLEQQFKPGPEERRRAGRKPVRVIPLEPEKSTQRSRSPR
jgi:hypothetical protein